MVQQVLPRGAAKTLEDIEGLRSFPAMSGNPAFAQQQQQQQQQQLPPIGGPIPANNPGNTLLSLLQANARSTPIPQVSLWAQSAASTLTRITRLSFGHCTGTCFMLRAILDSGGYPYIRSSF